MEVLWAPWRLEYIKKVNKGNECILCKSLKNNKKLESLVTYKGERVFVILNRFPYNSGHLMVAPLRHVSELSNLTPEESSEIIQTLIKSIEVLKKELKPHGFNVGLNIGRVAGAGIEDHLHFHVVPRWGGDTNFMPVLAETKVIPEHLIKTCQKLKKAFKRI